MKLKIESHVKDVLEALNEDVGIPMERHTKEAVCLI